MENKAKSLKKSRLIKRKKNSELVVKHPDDELANNTIEKIPTGELNNPIDTSFTVQHKQTTNSKEKSHYCYILKNHHEPDINRTYNGYTVNPKRRLRQHNQEIKGGADYTKTWGAKTWDICVLIKGFPDQHNATQCEWKIKHPARKRIRPAKYNNPMGRIMGLNEILQLDRWTGSSTIDNKDLFLKIWILEEYTHLLSDVPDNFEVIPVHVIDLSHV
jgi:predicted GIY-YIG superfamily endonuclease